MYLYLEVLFRFNARVPLYQVKSIGGLQWVSEQQVVSAPSLEWACWLLSFLFEVEADITSNSSLCVHNLGVFNALVRYLRSSGSPFKQRVVTMLVRHLQEPQKFPEAPPLHKLSTLGKLVMKMAKVQVKKKEQLSSGLLGLVELHIATVRSCRMFPPSGKTPHLLDEPIPASPVFQLRPKSSQERVDADDYVDDYADLAGDFDPEEFGVSASYGDASTSVSDSPSSSVSESGSEAPEHQPDDDGYSYSGSVLTESESGDDNDNDDVVESRNDVGYSEASWSEGFVDDFQPEADTVDNDDNTGISAAITRAADVAGDAIPSVTGSVVDSATAITDGSRDPSETTLASPGETPPVDNATAGGTDTVVTPGASESGPTNIAGGVEPHDMPSSLTVQDTQGFKVELPPTDLDKVTAMLSGHLHL